MTNTVTRYDMVCEYNGLAEEDQHQMKPCSDGPWVSYEAYAELVKQIESLKVKQIIAMEGLVDIANPVGRYKRLEKEGYRINGTMVISLIKDPETYKSIAVDALKRMQET